MAAPIFGIPHPGVETLVVSTSLPVGLPTNLTARSTNKSTCRMDPPPYLIEFAYKGHPQGRRSLGPINGPPAKPRPVDGQLVSPGRNRMLRRHQIAVFGVSPEGRRFCEVEPTQGPLGQRKRNDHTSRHAHHAFSISGLHRTQNSV